MTFTQATTLTPAERGAAVDLLTDSARSLRSATAGLTDRQWRFEPAPGRWAAADIVEHLARSEQAVFQLVTRQLVRQPVLAADRRSTLKDIAIALAVRNRDVRFQAADLVRPTRSWTTTGGLSREFDSLRAAIRLSTLRAFQWPPAPTNSPLTVLGMSIFTTCQICT